MDKSKGSVKKVLKIILDVFVWIFVVFAVVVTMLAFAAQANDDGIPSVGGKCILTVQSDSMNPTFFEGDIIIGQRLTLKEAASLKVDDIISYKTRINGVDTINTHRIVEITSDGDSVAYITMGDNKETNKVVDEGSVLPVNIVAQYTGTRIGGLGKVLSFLQQPTGFLVCIVLPLVLFFLYELFMFIKKYLEVKNSGKKQITAADEELIRQQAVAEYLRQQQEKEQAQQAAPPAEPDPVPEETPEETVEEKAEPTDAE